MGTCEVGPDEAETRGEETVEYVVGEAGGQVERRGALEGLLPVEGTHGRYDDNFHVLVVDKLLEPFAEGGGKSSTMKCSLK